MSYNKEVDSPLMGEKGLSGFTDHQLEEDILASHFCKRSDSISICNRVDSPGVEDNSS